MLSVTHIKVLGFLSDSHKSTSFSVTCHKDLKKKQYLINIHFQFNICLPSLQCQYDAIKTTKMITSFTDLISRICVAHLWIEIPFAYNTYNLQ